MIMYHIVHVTEHLGTGNISHSLSFCLDQREGLQLFADIVYTLYNVINASNFFCVMFEE